MEGPPVGPGGEDITWPDQVAPRGRKASSTRKIKPQTSNLYLLPLLWGAFQVEGFLLASEGPAFHPPEALLALGFSQGHEALLEGVPCRHRGAEYALGHHCKTPQRGEHAARWEGLLGSPRGGSSLRRARSEAVLPEAEGSDPARGVGPMVDGPLQAFQPPNRGEQGVQGSPAEY